MTRKWWTPVLHGPCALLPRTGRARTVASPRKRFVHNFTSRFGGNANPSASAADRVELPRPRRDSLTLGRDRWQPRAGWACGGSSSLSSLVQMT